MGEAAAHNRASSRALAPALKKLGRHCWHVSPQWLRCAFLEALCRTRAVPAQGVCVEDDGPMYVCGAFQSLSGLAQGARLYLAARKREGRKVFGVDVGKAMRAGRELELMPGCLELRQLREMTGSGTVVIHANPPGFQLALAGLGKSFLRGKRVVAYWAWEVEDLPLVWKQALAFVDVIETPSTFVADIMRAYTNKPVRVVPHQLPAPSPFIRVPFDGRLRCLFIFDAASGWERKNPQAALAAFVRAFSPQEGSLSIKISHAEGRQFEEFACSCAAYPHVRLMREPLDAAGMEALFAAHDVYLSLHRSEGFGLTIQEAMLRGLHAIATGWSGNMDFMRGPLAHPVPYAMTAVKADGVFSGIRGHWAEPDIDAAAVILRTLRSELSAA